MKFARVVFILAGVWGIAVLTPLFFLVDITGQAYAPPTSYPHFFYGFLSVALAWQTAFLVIGSNPLRYRLLMLPSILEKVGYIAGTTVLYNHGRISSAEATTAVPDFVLCLLFVVSFATTSRQSAGV